MHAWRQDGSIPAPAGEPFQCRTAAGPLGLSPRLRGNRCPQPESPRHGLSPRLRGNPLPIAMRSLGSAVYPRACGGTFENRHQALRGSIPAPAGEPPSSRAAGEPGRNLRVYPRACGGTGGEPVYPRACGGEFRVGSGRVYPRACGGTVLYRLFPPGSIPAPAGEPRRLAIVGPSKFEGLSPRLRGNRRKFRGSRFWARSIPAPAGEPALTICLAVW